MAEESFDPNRRSFADCLSRLQAATEKAGFRADGRIITSRDADACELLDSLQIDNVPDGFKKWQLPIYLSSASHLFVTDAEPGAKASSHAHKEGEGIRFIVSGSIVHDGTELIAGDWMFIPAGQEYDFEVGPLGARMCYCYCCCCA